MKAIQLLLVMAVLSFTLHSQQKEITGTVTTVSDGLPLPGANVIVKGTSQGTQTDFDGNYSIYAKMGDTLQISYVGYKTSEVKIGTSNVYDVALEASASLEEVVVVGYQSIRNSSSTSHSISRVKSESIKNVPINSINNVLRGNAAGVNVSSVSGQPGQDATIVIRGRASSNSDSEPLFIVDGVPVDQNQFRNLNQSDITSMSVLKDANAQAIYGNRGAGGVILITTNKSELIKSDKLYIVDGKEIPRRNNMLLSTLSSDKIESKIEYSKAMAKKKFGSKAKNGCIVITTHQGNYRLPKDESYKTISENSFEHALISPLSTFSIDVDKAAYSNIRRMINNGQHINPDAVKIEEMINYFDYSYPQPTDEHPFSITTDVVNSPWNKSTRLVRIGLQGKRFENSEIPPSNLTFLIDVSGSMDSPNKLPLLKSAFKFLVNQLRPEDRVSIVVYAGAAGVVLEPTAGNKKKTILKALNNLEAGGSTAGGEGIELAYKLAQQNFKKKGNNRVILATDGDFNVGASSDEDMQKLIEEKRNSGVFLSVLGFGMGNYKDSKLEILADKGNGNHAYIDNMQEAQKIFGKEFGGTLFTIAKDVKIQVEFNPNKVSAYRLIGYENRLLADEDFIDDTKDAGELGSGHTVTALYEIIPKGVESNYLKNTIELKYTDTSLVDNYRNELFTVKFRYKKPKGSKSIEMVHVQEDTFSEPNDDFSFACAVALFGMQLRESKYFNEAPRELVLDLAKKGRGKDENGYRAEFIRLVKSYDDFE